MLNYWAHLPRTFLIVGIMSVVTTPAVAETLTYKVYAGGMNVITAPLVVDMSRSTYTAELTAKTRGFLGTLVPWEGGFQTKGTRNKNKLTVKTHRSTSTWRGEEDSASYKYDTQGNLTALDLRKDGRDEKPKLDPVLTRGVTDILSASLMAFMHAENGGECAGASDIFDSKRRFTLDFKPVGKEILPKSRYTMYQGLAVKCTAEVIPKGGAWHKKPRGWLSIQEQGRSAGMMPTLWVAKVHPNLPPMPVKIRIKTDYGTLFMHLAEVK
jgi:hypothetical protein